MEKGSTVEANTDQPFIGKVIDAPARYGERTLVGIDRGVYTEMVPIEQCSELIQCWCGAIGSYEEMFNDGDFREVCDGNGSFDCECGGDNLCVCHHHGTIDCEGCPMCEEDDDW